MAQQVTKQARGRVAATALVCCVLALCTSMAWAAPATELAATAPLAARANSEAQKPGSLSTVFEFGWADGVYHAKGRVSISTFDVTGDGAPDRVTLAADPLGDEELDRTGLAGRLALWVNGAEAYSLSAPEEGFDRATVAVATLKNGVPVVFASAYGADGSARQDVLHYEDGAFASVVDNGLVDGAGSAEGRISQLLVSGNRLIAQFDFVSCVTGQTRTSFTYAYSAGAFKRTSSSSKALRFAGTATGAYLRQPLKAARSLTAFTTAKLKNQAFTVPAGKTVRVLAVQLGRDQLLYQLQYGSKKGWIAGGSYAEYPVGKVLRGTYGSLPQANDPAPYGESATWGVSRLQALSNHALLVSRNELFARHGYAFSNAELTRYFQATSWYVPDPDADVSLDEEESAAASLMRSIETNRRSPYVD